jgi:hypothetical protein
MVVSVPATSDQEEVTAAMDAARALIAEADAAERSPANAKVEASVRDWWAGRQGNASSSPVAKPGSVRAEVEAEVEAEVKAEQRWPMACTLVLALAVPLLLPPRFSLGPPWAVPALEALLLAAIIVIDRGRIDRRSALGRVLALVLAAVLIADAVGVSGRLVVDLIEGGPETNSAADLLKTGFLVWLYTIIAFTLLYWVLDGGGPERVSWLRGNFPTSPSPSSSARKQLARAGTQNSSTTSTSAYRRHRAQPDRRHAAGPVGQICHDGTGGRLPHGSGTGDCPGRQYPEVAARRKGSALAPLNTQPARCARSKKARPEIDLASELGRGGEI